jgi:hypothetical protein
LIDKKNRYVAELDERNQYFKNFTSEIGTAAYPRNAINDLLVIQDLKSRIDCLDEQIVFVKICMQEEITSAEKEKKRYVQ